METNRLLVLLVGLIHLSLAFPRGADHAENCTIEERVSFIVKSGNSEGDFIPEVIPLNNTKLQVVGKPRGTVVEEVRNGVKYSIIKTSVTVVISPPPTTSSPATSPPTTSSPATFPPITSPATSPPTTSSPATSPPTTYSPATFPPVTSPVTSAPTTSSPVTSPPTTSSPATFPPVTSPVTSPPTTSSPATSPPTTSSPATFPPINSPATSPPTTSAAIPPPTTSPPITSTPIITTTEATTTTTSRVPEGYITLPGFGSYKYYEREPIENMREICAKEDAFVAYPVYLEEVDAMAKQIISTSVTYLAVGITWNETGMYDSEGGTPYFNKNIWESGEPSSGNCSALNMETKRMESISCEDNLPFVCKKDDGFESGYGYYTIHAPVDISMMEGICRRNNRTVAIPQSIEEAEVMVTHAVDNDLYLSVGVRKHYGGRLIRVGEIGK
ncbi:uncharacterized protein [Anabrus simplex]|uniref:uncharacterized protein isoform X2 n=1 Tax=Anabrus simplex TaxID=316456 RepID=UPI0035A2F7F7